MNRALIAILTVFAMWSFLGIAGEAPAAGSLAFRADGKEFKFDTGVLRGKLRADGRANGLSSVIHVPSGLRLDASLGLFSHYRVFSSRKRYGTGAWDWPAESILKPDGSVETRWAAAADRPFEMTARYRWASPEVLLLETRVQARESLPKFECFLASYFSSEFTNALVCVNPVLPAFAPALPSLGVWQAYLRDETAKEIFTDGRWKLEPNPVDWVLLPQFARPLAMRRAPARGVTAVIVAPVEDCFAVCTPHQLEGHYSTYLSLFGKDVPAGREVKARAALRISTNLTEQAAMDFEPAY